MKAENMKERKREEKERKEKDPVWLIFQRPDVGGPSRQPESCKIRALDVHESKDREVSLMKKAVCEKIIGIPRFNLEIWHPTVIPKWGQRAFDCGRSGVFCIFAFS